MVNFGVLSIGVILLVVGYVDSWRISCNSASTLKCRMSPAIIRPSSIPTLVAPRNVIVYSTGLIDNDAVDDNLESFDTYLKNEFSGLSGPKEFITFEELMQWDEIQALFNDGMLEKEQLTSICQEYAPDGRIDEEAFRKINLKVDELTYVSDEEFNEDNFEVADVWDRELNATEFYDTEQLDYLRDFFQNFSTPHPSGVRLLKAEDFIKADEVKSLTEEFNWNEQFYHDLWKQGINFQLNRTAEDVAKDLEARESAEGVNFDTFLRINYQLQTTVSELSAEDVEGYYTATFEQLAAPHDYLTFAQLMEWDAIQRLLEDGVVSTERIRDIWNSLPKEEMTRAKGGNGFGEEKVEIIKVEAFSSFLNSIDDDIATHMKNYPSEENSGMDVESSQ